MQKNRKNTRFDIVFHTKIATFAIFSFPSSFIINTFTKKIE